MTLALLAVIFALFVADALTTVFILDSGGAEKNPPLRWLMEQIGVVPALAIMKGAAYLACLAYPHTLLLAVVIVVYSAVVVHNYQQVRKIKAKS